MTTAFISNPTAEQLREFVQAGYRKFVVDNDMSGIEEYVTSDYAGHYLGVAETSGIEAFKEFIASQNNAFSDRELQFHDVIVEGEKVALRVTFSGTHTGDLMGIPATGKRVTIEGIDIFRFEDGLAAEQWSIRDNMALMVQLGVIPAPAQ